MQTSVSWGLTNTIVEKLINPIAVFVDLQSLPALCIIIKMSVMLRLIEFKSFQSDWFYWSRSKR